MSIMSQFTSLATNSVYNCDSAINSYKNFVGNINSDTSLRFGNKVSEDVANFVSSPPVSDKMGAANEAFDYLTNNCSMPENVVRHFANYNQNIYDSLEIYKNTTHAIPEFSEISMIMIGLSFVGIIALTMRNEIVSALKKLVRF